MTLDVGIYANPRITRGLVYLVGLLFHLQYDAGPKKKRKRFNLILIPELEKH